MEKFADLQYVRPDMEKVFARVSGDIAALKSAKSYEEFRSAYMDYVEADTELETAKTVAHIRNTINLLDEFYEGEMAYFNSQMPKYGILEKEMGEVIVASPFKDEMEKEFGSILLQNMEAQKQLSDESIVDDQVKESELVNQYMKAQAAATVDFRGEQLGTYGLLKHMQSTDRAERKEAFEAWAKLYAGIAPKLDEVYDGLVKVRSGMAKKLGFDSFIPMGYMRRRRFDYTEKDLEVFRKQVREIVVPAANELYERQRKALGIDMLYYYDESLTSPTGNPVPIGDKEYLVGEAQKMYRELSKESGEFFDFMTEHDLFDLESKHGKRAGGYCTMLPQYHAPFIFSNFNGTDADVNVLTHEAGHAFAGFTASKFQKIPELCHSTSEIAEIHSMSMELWTYPWMEKFFGGKAENYRKDHLADVLMKIPYMVCVDEYQHKVFEKLEMTAMERRAVWSSLEKVYMPWRNYDGNEFLEGGGFWMQKQHIFLYPFYYIEYALAQICAFQFYLRMLEDQPAAWADYLRLCRAGGSRGYFELLKIGNLENPFAEGTVETAISAVARELDRLDGKLNG